MHRYTIHEDTYLGQKWQTDGVILSGGFTIDYWKFYEDNLFTYMPKGPSPKQQNEEGQYRNSNLPSMQSLWASYSSQKWDGFSVSTSVRYSRYRTEGRLQGHEAAVVWFGYLWWFREIPKIISFRFENLRYVTPRTHSRTAHSTTLYST